MPRNRGQQGQRPTERKHAQAQSQALPERSEPRDTARPADYDKIGPLSVEGVEASDLPDKGRGDVFTNPGKEAARKFPDRMGDSGGGEIGMRGHPDIAEAAKSGGRKRN